MSGAALAASPVGMAAGVALPLSVAAALMGSVPLVVVAAHCIRVIGQSACQQVGHRLVRRPRYAGIELDLRLGQGCSGTAANTAATIMPASFLVFFISILLMLNCFSSRSVR